MRIFLDINRQASDSKGDPNALIMMGAVMFGGQVTAKVPISSTQCTPLARLTRDYKYS